MHILIPVSIFFVYHAVTIAAAGAMAKAKTNIYQTRVLSSAGRRTSAFAVPSSNGVGGSECWWKAEVRYLLGLLVGRVTVIGYMCRFCFVVSFKIVRYCAYPI